MKMLSLFEVDEPSWIEAIRKRLGNALSPEIERDYLERLLEMR